jgi:hypothetical protein
MLEFLPGLPGVGGVLVPGAEQAEVTADLAQVPPEPVQRQRFAVDLGSGRGRVAVQQRPVVPCEVPQVAFGRGEQGRVPVDEDQPAAGHDHVAGMRLAVGDDHALRA